MTEKKVTKVDENYFKHLLIAPRLFGDFTLELRTKILH